MALTDRVSGLAHRAATLMTRTPASILACESDGFVLRGGVFQVQGRVATAVRTAESRAIDPREAVGDLITRLGARESLPTRAVLLTPGMVTALLALPVEVGKPRLDREMQELIRWEMEPLLAQQIGQWTIGAILQGRGHLTQQQRADVVRHAGGIARSGGARFGEQAIELGLVTREQVEEALDLQRHLQIVDQDLVCGWTVPSESAAEPGAPRWLSCAVGASLQRQWAEAFAHNGLTLEWLYPLTGPSLAALPPGQKEQAVLELHHDVVACIRASEGAVDGLRVVPFTGDRLSIEDCIEACHDLTRLGMQTLWVRGNGEDHPQLMQQLSARIGLPLKTLTSASGTDAALPLAGAAGAACHALGLVPATLAVRLRATPPGPPLYKRPSSWLTGAAAALVLAIGATELSLYLKEIAISAELAEHQKKLAAIEQAEEEEARSQEQATEAEKKLAAVKDELANWQKRQAFMEQTILKREQMMREFLVDIASSVSPSVVLDRIAEVDARVIEVNAWALTEGAAHQYAHDLASLMQRWAFSVENLAVRAQVGPLSLQGYGISLALMPGAATAVTEAPVPGAEPPS